MTIKVTGNQSNLEAFARFFSDIQDAEVKATDGGLTVGVENETGNARFIKYVAEKFGCSAKQELA